MCYTIGDKNMKKIISKLLSLVFVSISLFACNNVNNGASIFSPKPSFEDCERDYRDLVNASFSYPERALSRVQDFISTYAETGYSRVDDAYRIKIQVEDIKDFLGRSFESVNDFLYQANQKGNAIEKCEYPIVKFVWNNAFEDKKKSMFENAISKLTCDSFEPYFSSAVRKIVNDDYDNEQLFGWDIERVDLVSLSEPEDVPEIYGKECTAVYRVHLRGNTLGIDTGTLKIQIIGRLSLTTLGELMYKTKDYSYLEKSSKL